MNVFFPVHEKETVWYDMVSWGDDVLVFLRKHTHAIRVTWTDDSVEQCAGICNCIPSICGQYGIF